MHRKTALLVGMLALMLVAPQANAAKGDWLLNLNAGTGIPVGDYKDDAKLGFLGGVGLGYGMSESISLGVDGSYITNSGSDQLESDLSGLAGTPVTGKFELIQGGVHLKYLFPMAAESSMAPYLVAGAGVYNVKSKLESSNSLYNGETSDSKFGARGGLGINYKTSDKVGIGVEGVYNWIDTEISSTQYIGVTAGVTINMSTPK